MEDAPTLSPEEREQVLQTIEMFEVIVQANPHDLESLGILKDAYGRLGRTAEARRTARLIADANIALKQFSAAVIELEEMLSTEPDNPELIALLGDVEEKMHQSAAEVGAKTEIEFGAAVSESGSLMATAATASPRSTRVAASAANTMEAQLAKDGDEPFARFLIQTRLVPEDLVIDALDRVQKHNRDLPKGALAASLLEEISARGQIEMETLLAGVVDRTKFAYIPLEYYDVDRQVVKMFPENLTLSRLIVPFDVLSRTLMVATVNPFDASAKAVAQQQVDLHIQWHLASPAAVLNLLRQIYRLDAASPSPSFTISMPDETPATTEAPLPNVKPEPAVAAAPGGSGPDTSHFRIVS